VTELFMITGPAGSGKTTLGVAVAARLNAVVLDLDDVATGLVAQYRQDHPEASEADALGALRHERYAVLAEDARVALAAGSLASVVLIAPFTGETSSPDRWTRWIADLGVPPERAHLVWLAVPAVERLRRLATRGAVRDEQVVAAGSLPEPVPPAVPALVVDAGLPLADQVELVLQRFGNG
jgi:sugar-phosphatase